MHGLLLGEESMKRLTVLSATVALAVSSANVHAGVEDPGHINLGPVEMVSGATVGIGYYRVRCPQRTTPPSQPWGGSTGTGSMVWAECA